ncbi:MAG: M3 family oligoendopeptidase [Sphaerochaetaceae bacterium]
MEKLPHWDLQSIYPGITSQEFNSDLLALKRLTDQLAGILSDSQGMESSLEAWMLAVLDTYQTLSDTMETLEAYAQALLTVNTSDEVAMRGLNQVEKASLDVQSIHVRMLNVLSGKSQAIRELLETAPALKLYHFVVSELLDGQKYQMSEAEEALAADMNRSGTDAWGRLQEAISSSADTVWDESTGERKTVIQLRSMAFNPDRTIREKAFYKELAVWKLHEVSFAYALNGVKGTTLTLDKRRGFKDPLQRAVIQSRINDGVLEALMGSIQKNLPMFRRYLKAKAHLLGLPRLGFFDLFAPVGEKSRTYSYAEARDFIVRTFTDFHPALGGFAASAFCKNWIDSESRAGKVGGAYCTSFPLRQETRILANFDGSFDGVSTLAHELGHAYHDKVTCQLPALLRHYPMTLAETASIFSQFIIFQGALKDADADQRITLIESFLSDATQTCVDILSRFLFEKELFARRAEGDLMAGELSQMMVDVQKRTYGDALDEQQLHPWMWAVKGHYYSTGLSFYNFPYAFGQLFGLGVYQQSQHSQQDFGAQYDELLFLTGQDSAPQVTATIGCDIATESFWQESLDLIGCYVDEFCALCGYVE